MTALFRSGMRQVGADSSPIPGTRRQCVGSPGRPMGRESLRRARTEPFRCGMRRADSACSHIAVRQPRSGRWHGRPAGSVSPRRLATSVMNTPLRRYRCGTPRLGACSSITLFHRALATQTGRSVSPGRLTANSSFREARIQSRTSGMRHSARHERRLIAHTPGARWLFATDTDRPRW